MTRNATPPNFNFSQIVMHNGGILNSSTPEHNTSNADFSALIQKFRVPMVPIELNTDASNA